MQKRSKSKQFFGLLLCRACLYQRLFSISILSLCGFTLTRVSNAVTPNAQLQDWRFSPEAAQLEFTLSAGSVPKVFFLSQPSRLVVDLPGTKLGFVPTQQNYSGAIQSIRLSQLNANVTRIVLDFAPGTAINPSQVLVQPISPTNWVLRPFANFTNNTAPIRNAPQGANNTPPGFYQPLPPNSTVPGIYAPLPPNNTAPGIFAPLPPNNNIPSGINAPQPPGLVTTPGTIPSTNNTQQQQPFVSVPPLTTNNSSQIPGSILPPATFPNPSGGIVNTPPLIVPNYNVPTTVPTTVLTYPSNPINNTNPGVVPWGQSLPSQR